MRTDCRTVNSFMRKIKMDFSCGLYTINMKFWTPFSCTFISYCICNFIPNEDINNQEKDDEISLIDLFAVLLRRKWLIIIITMLAAIGVVLYSVISLKLPPEKSYLPNTYTVTANMLIKDNNGSSSANLSGAAGAAASLMGINLSGGGSSTSSLVLYLTSSNPFYDAIAEKFDLYTKYKFEKSPVANTRQALQKVISTNFDTNSGVFSISFKDIDPQFGVEVINFSVDWLSNKLEELGVDNNIITKENLEKNLDISWNQILKLTKEISDLQDKVAQGRVVWTKDFTIEQNRIELELSAQKSVYTQLKSQLELLKVQMQTETPQFQILERPSVPDMKSGPSRGKLCIIVTFAAFFVSIFLAFLLNAIENIKKDPEAMAKLSSHKKSKK